MNCKHCARSKQLLQILYRHWCGYSASLAAGDRAAQNIYFNRIDKIMGDMRDHAKEGEN